MAFLFKRAGSTSGPTSPPIPRVPGGPIGPGAPMCPSFPGGPIGPGGPWRAHREWQLNNSLKMIKASVWKQVNCACSSIKSGELKGKLWHLPSAHLVQRFLELPAHLLCPESKRSKLIYLTLLCIIFTLNVHPRSSHMYDGWVDGWITVLHVCFKSTI